VSVGRVRPNDLVGSSRARRRCHLPSLRLPVRRRVLRTVWVAAAVVCLPLAAAAAEWVKVPAKDLNQHSYDRSKLLVEGDSITYWRRVVFRAPQRTSSGTAVSGMYRERIDCHAHTHRTFGYLLYARNGSVIDNVRTPDAEAEPVVPETVGDRYEKLMCGLAPQVAAEQKAAEQTARSVPRSAEELRQEIEWLEARLRILREQIDLQSRPTAPPPAATPPAR
jgi:hypothetical protein